MRTHRWPAGNACTDAALLESKRPGVALREIRRAFHAGHAEAKYLSAISATLHKPASRPLVASVEHAGYSSHTTSKALVLSVVSS